ncbi:MAG TPA: AAA family ATPase [Alphaproteobacteria bacterium]|nr:AAA family ATPase [Alphaproteobacteria bacterium]
MARRAVKSRLSAPFLRRLALVPERMAPGGYPFDLPILQQGRLEIAFEKRVTILVGENGTGKSTLLEAIAHQSGFNVFGGNRNHGYRPGQGATVDVAPLSRALRLSWLPRMTSGFFLRAESFFEFAAYLDAGGGSFEARQSHGRQSLHALSHGESFLALFQERFGARGIYLLDEPEAALSPSRQLAFIALLKDMEESGDVQFIIATHAPMLMAYPGAEVLQIKDGEILAVDYRDTDHYRLMRRFLEDPAQYLAHLLDSRRHEAERPARS